VRAGLDDVTQPVEYLPQAVLALPRRLRQQRQVGRDQCRIVIGNVGEVGLAHMPQRLITTCPGVQDNL
jgi:hypothetical protein